MNDQAGTMAKPTPKRFQALMVAIAKVRFATSAGSKCSCKASYCP